MHSGTMVPVAVIQVRGVSDRAHKRLKDRAAREGKSLSEYLRFELERLAAQPTLEEMLDRVAARKPVDLGQPTAEIIRQQRR